MHDSLKYMQPNSHKKSITKLFKYLSVYPSLKRIKWENNNDKWGNFRASKPENECNKGWKRKRFEHTGKYLHVSRSTVECIPKREWKFAGKTFECLLDVHTRRAHDDNSFVDRVLFTFNSCTRTFVLFTRLSRVFIELSFIFNANNFFKFYLCNVGNRVYTILT